MFQEIPLNIFCALRVILKKTQRAIAVDAQKPTNLAASVTVINNKHLMMCRDQWRLVAYGTLAVLKRVHRYVFIVAHSVFSGPRPNAPIFPSRLIGFSPVFGPTIKHLALFCGHVGSMICVSILFSFRRHRTPVVMAIRTLTQHAPRTHYKMSFVARPSPVKVAARQNVFTLHAELKGNRAISIVGLNWRQPWYSLYGQGVNLRDRFANWLGSLGAQTPCGPLSILT